MIANNKMVRALKNVHTNKKVLCSSLKQILLLGFQSEDGCFFLKYNYRNHTNASSEDFIDKTGYECFINSINIDDFVEKDYYVQGLLFCEDIFEKWKKISHYKLISIFIADEMSFKIKFHVERKDEHWLSTDLEKYEEATLVISSNDDITNLFK